MKNLNWKTRQSVLASVKSTRYTCEVNEAGQSLFVIQKDCTGSNANKFCLHCSVNTNFTPVRIGIFKTKKDAKLVAEIIYKNSIYSKKKDDRKKTK